jgi:uncharacterized protein with HEPN domain
MSKPRYRLQKIVEKIDYIQKIVADYDSLEEALADKTRTLPAILMHLASMAEQFNKLSREGEYEILAHFDKNDLKGCYDLRNYIVHDYEGINLDIISKVISERLPIIKATAQKLLEFYTK